MAQFDVYLLQTGVYVIDVQSPIASVHGTRLVIPLADPDDIARPIARLNPPIALDEKTWLLAIQFASTIDETLLRNRIGSVAHEEYTLKSALDFLISGF